MWNTASRLSEGGNRSSRQDAHWAYLSILRHEVELRARIADLIATVSLRENWKLRKCAAVARRVEKASFIHLESVHEYFHSRREQYPIFETPEILSDFFGNAPQFDDVRKPAPKLKPRATSVADLYGRMQALEARVTDAPGASCGVQGIRIMRMVALMSKAHAAEIVEHRLMGMRAIYRHE